MPKLIENMAYNNFILRLLFSILFVSIYFIFTYINFNYVFYLILFIYLLIFIEIYIYFKSYKLIPIIYLFVSFCFFIIINFDEISFLNFNLFILIVTSFDIFSYITGKVFGNNKLTNISPNKTYEGFLGGIFFSLLISLIYSFMFEIKINKELIIYVFFIIFSSFSGDIIESYFKRKNNIKNSSGFIPGHGGIFDRFDSFLFSIIFYSISINI